MKFILIGRSNVGKSTIFNKIIKKNKAIISNTLFFTKDINKEYFKWNKKYHIIYDTAGINFKKKNIKKINNKIKSIDIILFIVSLKEGLLQEDKEIFNYIKLYNKKIFLIINKTDNNFSYNLYEFYNLGIKNFFYTSAINNIGINFFLKKIFLKIKNVTNNIKKNKKNILKISIIGRQNVGKTTLFNTLLNKNKNIINDKAGTTVDSINSIYNKYNLYFLLYDTPGIFKKKKKKIDNIIFKNTLKTIKNSNICLFIIDFKLGFLKEEFYILKYIIKYYKLTIIIFNKIDLIKKKKILKIKKKYELFLKKKNIYKNIKIIYICAKKKKYNYKIIKNIKMLLYIIKYKIKKKNIKNIINNINKIYKKKIIVSNIIQSKKKKQFILKILYNNIIKKKQKIYICNYIKKYINYNYPINFIFKKNKYEI